MRWQSHSDFSAGMVQDFARHMLPDRAVWDAFDCFLQEDGTMAQRGAAITALSAANVVSPADMMILDSSEPDDVLRGIIYDESGGVGTSLKTSAFTPGAGTFAPTVPSAIAGGWVTPTGGSRPIKYYNRILRANGIPSVLTGGHTYRPLSIFGGGAHALTARTGTVTITATQGDNVLTGFAIADVAAMEVGNIVTLIGATQLYIGRIIAIPSTTTIAVSPTPSIATWNTGANTWAVRSMASSNLLTTGTPTWICGARSVAAWGERVVLGGVAYDLLNSGTKLQVNANRIVWGLLPAIDSTVFGSFTVDGFREGVVDSFLARDFTDVMGAETILGLEPVNAGELLVISQPRLHRVVGYFSTQTTQAGGGLTWETRPIQDNVFPVSDRATATTPQGVVFAGADGVYLYRDGRARNMMDGRIKNLWISTLQGGATVTGGGYIGQDHYFVSLTTGWFLCNMDGFRWTSGALSSIGGAVPDPTRPGRYYGFRKNPGTASDTTKVFRLDTVLSPGNANRTDAHAWNASSGPAMSVKTRVYVEGDPSRLKRYRHIRLTVRMPGASGTITVTETPGLDAEESSATLGTIATPATSPQVSRYDRVAISRGYALTIAKTAGSPDEIELLDLDIASTQLRAGRILA